jgi:hypothetical protein
MPRPRTPGLGTGFRRPAGCQKQLEVLPHIHHPPQEVRMLAAYLHDLWLGNLVRSSLRRDVAFSPSAFLHKARV